MARKCCRKLAFEQALLAKSWLVMPSELTYIRRGISVSPDAIKQTLIIYLLFLQVSLRHLGSVNDPQLLQSITSGDSSVADDFSPGFTGMGLVKGQKVATKKYLTNGSELVVKNREDLMLLKSVR